MIYISLVTFLSAQGSSVNASRANGKADYMVLDSTVFYLLVGGGANYIQNESSLPVVPGGFACGEFENGNGFSGYFNIGGGYELFDGMLNIESRLLIESRPAILTTETSNYQVLNAQNEYVPLDLIHNFEASLLFSGLTLGANLYPFVDIPFSLGTSVDWSAPLFSSEFTQTDEIQAPSNVRFAGSRTRTVGEGDYDNTQSSYGVTALARYDLPAGDNMVLQPEISYRYGLNSISTDGQWNQNIARVGINILFDIKIYEKVYGRVGKNVPQPSPPIAKKEIIVEETKKAELATDGEKNLVKQEAVIETDPEIYIRDISFKPIALTETIVSQTYPILPYIFFEPGSDIIPDRYGSGSDPSDFDERSLPKSTLDIYYATLDIIGSRMLSDNGNITITGYHNGIESESAEVRDELALGRANAIKNYLIDNWSVSPSRISTDAADLPPITTSNIYEEGPEENSRAEISSDNPDLLEPIVFKNFLEYSISDNALLPYVSIENEDVVDNIELILSDGDQDLLSFNGNIAELKANGLPYSQTDLVKLAGAIDSSVDSQLEIKAVATDKNGEKYIYSSQSSVSKDRSDYEVGRINLIVFDFDQSSLSEENMRMLDKFAVRDDWENSDITVTGSTDKLGERQYNKNLSMQRAVTTERYLNQINSKLPEMTILGLGSSNLPFDNNLPEGRFYCRTVLIEVKTPIKE
jgi:outer membrane protein OmpA-like peptidoglycan-associated protein